MLVLSLSNSLTLIENLTVLLTALKANMMWDILSLHCLTLSAIPSALDEGRSDIKKCNSLYVPNVSLGIKTTISVGIATIKAACIFHRSHKMVMIWRLKTLDLAKYMSRSVRAQTALETSLLTVSGGVSLSGSGRWKTASWHLFNKVGRLVNQPSHSLTLSLLTPTAWLTGQVAQPDVVFGEVARHEIVAGGNV